MLPTFRPNTRPELAAALDFIHQSLEEEKIYHVIQGEEEDDPNIWIVMAYDSDQHINSGIVAWDEEENGLSFIAHEKDWDERDRKAGLSEEKAKAWWDCKTAENFMMHLRGEVRKMMEELALSSTASRSTTIT